METLAALLGLGSPDVTAAMQLVLPLPGNAEQTIVTYQCADGAPFPVRYINAAPNFLALVPVGGQTLIFVTTLSGSGARYVSGQYEWWSTGTEATFADLTQPDADPLACAEVNNTP